MGTVGGLFKALVELRQEVFLDVDRVPAGVCKVLADREYGLAPESGLEMRVVFTDKTEDEWGDLRDVLLNYVVGHLNQKRGDELQSSRSHHTPVLLCEKCPHVVLSLLRLLGLAFAGVLLFKTGSHWPVEL